MRLRRRQNEILSEIVETERQLLLWGKKIQLEKETQAALDPEAGKGEVKGMEREVGCFNCNFNFKFTLPLPCAAPSRKCAEDAAQNILWVPGTAPPLQPSACARQRTPVLRTAHSAAVVTPRSGERTFCDAAR
jgi:hypothetical protein